MEEGAGVSTPERVSTGALMSITVMFAPSRAKAMAVARRMRRAVPVTTATLLRRHSSVPGIGLVMVHALTPQR
jgi:hypothetical protein